MKIAYVGCVLLQSRRGAVMGVYSARAVQCSVIERGNRINEHSPQVTITSYDYIRIRSTSAEETLRNVLCPGPLQIKFESLQDSLLLLINAEHKKGLTTNVVVGLVLDGVLYTSPTDIEAMAAKIGSVRTRGLLFAICLVLLGLPSLLLPPIGLALLGGGGYLIRLALRAPSGPDIEAAVNEALQLAPVSVRRDES